MRSIALHVPIPNADAAGIRGQPQAFLAGAQGCLGATLLFEETHVDHYRGGQKHQLFRKVEIGFREVTLRLAHEQRERAQ